MPTYIVLMNLTEQGIKYIKKIPERIEKVAKDLRKDGGRLIDFYTIMGHYDYIAIVEAPSDAAAMLHLLGLVGSGNLKTTTLKAFTTKELKKKLKALA